ncbi:DUF2085 domain-containing protein [Brevibacillus borstelensis]|uniref:DUF2085 domain-containing protein n=1 Tax=Brevibacillus borstelensis TaxID=45462 RepID=UPI0030BDE392
MKTDWLGKMMSLSFVPCHRMPSRSLIIRGKRLPLCARCTAILSGYTLLPLLLFVPFTIPWYAGVLLQVPMLVDGCTQYLQWRESNNVLRVVTGLLSGVGQSIFVVGVSRVLLEWLLKLM